jgi:hypothetical protein
MKIILASMFAIAMIAGSASATVLGGPQLDRHHPHCSWDRHHHHHHCW